MDKFESFLAKEKFMPEEHLFYSGLADPKLIPVLTSKINQAAIEFRGLWNSDHTTDKDYQEKIREGLERFNDENDTLDTEDRERICLYFEELMDMVGLESSGGHLNIFMYGFDPNTSE